MQRGGQHSQIARFWRARIQTRLVIAGVDSHGLLPHGRLVRVSGRLVVVGERDDGRAHTEDHTGVDLAVSVRARVTARLL